MRLVSDDGRVRVYEGADGFHETRAYVQGYSFECGSEVYDVDEIREHFEKISKEMHMEWLANRGAETFGEITTQWNEFEVTWSPGLVYDGEPVEYFEPFTLKRFMTEQGCWPPAPEDAP